MRQDSRETVRIMRLATNNQRLAELVHITPAIIRLDLKENMNLRGNKGLLDAIHSVNQILSLHSHLQPYEISSLIP